MERSPLNLDLLKELVKPLVEDKQIPENIEAHAEKLAKIFTRLQDKGAIKCKTVPGGVEIQGEQLAKAIREKRVIKTTITKAGIEYLLTLLPPP